jgi:hypothetical protein
MQKHKRVRKRRERNKSRSTWGAGKKGQQKHKKKSRGKQQGHMTGRNNCSRSTRERGTRAAGAQEKEE